MLSITQWDINIKLYFTNAIYVSSDATDYLTFVVKEDLLFKQKDNNSYLKVPYEIKEIPVPG